MISELRFWPDQSKRSLMNDNESVGRFKCHGVRLGRVHLDDIMIIENPIAPFDVEENSASTSGQRFGSAHFLREGGYNETE